MRITVAAIPTTAPGRLLLCRTTVRCPECRQIGVFSAITPDIYFPEQETPWGKRKVHAGSRICLNEDCRAHVFVVCQNQKLVQAIPPERIDFDSTNVPARVLLALEEAIACHATECYSAAATLARKTIEEICEERGAKGKNLEDRIKALGASIVIPQLFIDAMHDIRYLENDAAHVMAKTYGDVGRDEVEAAIDVAKEIIKACYQYVAIIDKLKALKKSATP